MRAEFLGNRPAFTTLKAAQQALDEWVDYYNTARPHQSLDMATPTRENSFVCQGHFWWIDGGAETYSATVSGHERRGLHSDEIMLGGSVVAPRQNSPG